MSKPAESSACDSAAVAAPDKSSIEGFLGDIFYPEWVARLESQQAQKDLSELAVFHNCIMPYAAGTVDHVLGCTFRYVVQFLDTDEALYDHGQRMLGDWFSSRAQRDAIKASGISARTYAQALVAHCTIVGAEKAVLQ